MQPQLHHKNITKLNASEFTMLEPIGKGTFGIVYKASWSNKPIQALQQHHQQQAFVAIKKIIVNPKYKHRQIQLLNCLEHQNIIKFYGIFDKYQPDTLLDAIIEAKNQNKNEKYIVMEYYPKNLSNLIKENKASLTHLPLKLACTYYKQILGALAYLDGKGICHRDIKPSNVLVNSNNENNSIAICDLGSAKELKQNQKSITYVCSRYYRAPQLILECQQYSTKIDIWSAGCIFLEMLTNYPIFNGNNNLDQLTKIIKILGTPKQQDLLGMKADQKFKSSEMVQIEPIGIIKWLQRFKIEGLSEQDKKLIKQIGDKCLVYDPQKRWNAVQIIDYLNEQGI